MTRRFGNRGAERRCRLACAPAVFVRGSGPEGGRYAAIVKAIAAAALLLLIAVVGVVAWHAAIFDAYSHNFGSLTPSQFESMNARMNLLEVIARFLLVALAIADIALIVVAARKRAYLALGLGVALAVVLALFFLVAQAAVGPAMIGLVDVRFHSNDLRALALLGYEVSP